MDPDVTLAKLRDAVATCRRLEREMDERQSGDFDLFAFWVQEVVTAADTLDKWMCRQGFLPREWAIGRPTESYQGYANRETWCLHLWLTNDESMYRTARSIAKGSSDQYEVAKNLQLWVAEVLWNELGRTAEGRNMIEDVGSLWRVDWQELAKALKAK